MNAKPQYRFDQDLMVPENIDEVSVMLHGVFKASPDALSFILASLLGVADVIATHCANPEIEIECAVAELREMADQLLTERRAKLDMMPVAGRA
jgi:hypothetical protein